jgi:hypothetical protein
VQKLESSGSEQLGDSPYSPDLACDFISFRWIQNSFFDTQYEIEDEFLAQVKDPMRFISRDVRIKVIKE